MDAADQPTPLGGRQAWQLAIDVPKELLEMTERLIDRGELPLNAAMLVGRCVTEQLLREFVPARDQTIDDAVDSLRVVVVRRRGPRGD
jgi:hypothetical protein